ncbi:hypothetical protein [Streptomyces mirabilis]|uniref:hypothetical protein n=1 Tax=Streptomyces mirabilis TaxID=68239 RepID=UPI0033C3BFE6
MKRCESKCTSTHPGGLVTFGVTEPVLTVLDVRGFLLEEMFLIGINADCGSIIVAEETRAQEAAAAPEPAYAVTVKRAEWGDRRAEYSRRDLEGSEPDHLIRDLTLSDGTVVMADGRWVR